MFCKYCPHFQITAMPIKGVDFGYVECHKYHLITEFLSMKKIELLECVVKTKEKNND